MTAMYQTAERRESVATQQLESHNDYNAHMPYGMVAEDRDVLPSELQLPTNDNRQTPIAYHGRKYNPRQDKSQGRAQWQEDAREHVRRSSIPTCLLDCPPPNMTMLAARYPTLDQEALMFKLQGEMIVYQRLNTSLWDALRPTIVIDGPFEVNDRLHLNTLFMIGDLRDGKGLWTWANDFGETSDWNSQVEITNKLATYPTLAINANRPQITKHCLDLLELWLTSDGSDVRRPQAFYVRLLASLPVAPSSEKVVLLRNFLAELVTKQDPMLSDPRKLVEMLDKHAATLGIPTVIGIPAGKTGGPLDRMICDTGGTTNAVMAAVAGKDMEQVVLAVVRALEDKGGKGRDEYRPNKGGNKCKFCSIDACQSEEWAKACKPCTPEAEKQECLSFRADSPLNKPPHGITLGRGDETMIRVCRGYVKLHPDVTTLRGLKFADLKQGSSDIALPPANVGTRKQATPLVGTASVRELVDFGEEITDAEAFDDWINSMEAAGHLAAPLIGKTSAVEPETPPVHTKPLASPESEAVKDAIQSAVSDALKEAGDRHEGAMRTMQARFDQRIAMATDTAATPPATPPHMIPVLASPARASRPTPEGTAPATCGALVDGKNAATTAAAHVLKGVLKYEDQLANLRARQATTLAAAVADKCVTTLRAVLSLRNHLSPHQLLTALLLGYIAAPHVAPPTFKTIRGMAHRVWQSLLSRIRVHARAILNKTLGLRLNLSQPGA